VRELREHKRMLMKLESFAMAAAVRFNDSRYRRLSRLPIEPIRTRKW